MAQAGPELQTWEDLYADRGLVPWGVSINEPVDSVQAYWEDELGHTHPWAADETFSTGRFFPGPMIGTPAYVVVDLCTMQVVTTQQGYSSVEETLFEPYLDRTCPKSGE